jgi:hypothetical protein
MGQEFELPSWLSTEQIAHVQQLAAEINSDHSSVPISKSTSQSYPVIGANDYNANAHFGAFDGTGYSIAILDTGADLNHPAFGPDGDSNGIADRIVYQYDFADGDADANDVDGHGTHVASISAGLAQGVNLIILKVFEDSGDGDFGYVKQALQWVYANASTYNIAAVNMSLGDNGNYGTSQQLYGIHNELALLEAMNVTSVVAAGNRFYQTGSTPGVAYPAADPSALAVSASWDANQGGWGWDIDGNGFTDSVDYSTGVDRVVSFSQRHSTLTDVFAPGARITAAGLAGGTATLSGTSMAAPHVAAAVALAHQMSEAATGSRLSIAELSTLFDTTGNSIYDGDDENDNVTNTNATYYRLNIEKLAEAILPPTVVDVAVSSTLSPHSYSFDAAGADGSGDQLKPVPVARANRVSITFSEDVDVVSGDLTLLALRYPGTFQTVSSFAYSDRTATWTFTQEFDANHYLITLSDTVEDMQSATLDGEWVNPLHLSTTGSSTFSSGDGVEGGVFEFVLNYLPGDLNGDGVSDIIDFGVLGGNLGMFPTGGAAYSDGDLTGDGKVDIIDFGILGDNLNTDLRDLVFSGDFNDDYRIDGTDFGILSSHWLQSVTPGTNGDVNGDGVVNFTDMGLQSGRWLFGFDWLA